MNADDNASPLFFLYTAAIVYILAARWLGPFSFLYSLFRLLAWGS
jgi:hypothetical protein